MSVASRVIDILGGVEVVAEITGLGVTQIYKWRYPRSRGGTDGLVPAQYQQPLLDYARGKKLALSPEHFFDAHDEEDKASRGRTPVASARPKQQGAKRSGAACARGLVGLVRP